MFRPQDSTLKGILQIKQIQVQHANTSPTLESLYYYKPKASKNETREIKIL